MLDFFTLRAIVKELDETVLPAKIDKVLLTGKTEIAVRVRGKKGRQALMLSVDPTSPCLYASGKTVQEPRAVSRFLQLMESHLRGGEMIRAGVESAAAYERVVRIFLARRDFSGEEKKYELVAEMIPHRARLLLCDADGRVLDLLASPALVRRTLAAEGSPTYRPPERTGTGKLDPAGFEESAFRDRLGDREALTPADLTRTFLGFSPLVATEVIYRAGGRLSMVPGAIREILTELESAPVPSVFREPTSGRPFALFPIRLRSLQESLWETFDSMNQAAEAYFGETGESEKLETGRRQIFKIIDGKIRRLQRTLGKVTAELEEAKEADRLRLYGELLKFHGPEEKTGRSTVRCMNYYAPDASEVEVPVDPSLSIRANAGRYFKKYAKAKRRLDASAARAETLRGEIASWEETRVAAEKAEIVSETDEILAELREPEPCERPGRREGKGKKRALGASLEPREFRSASFVILVGKSARGNDALSFRLARGDDFWLHAAGCPGSHVVVKNPDRLDSLPEEVLGDAAGLAAYFSKAGSDEKAEVHYTKRKYIQRVGGSAPGIVRLKKFSTIRVKPRLPDRREGAR